MESMSTSEFYTMESTSKRIDASETDNALLMELLDESPYAEEDNDEDDRLRRVIQSLEAEIGSEFGAMDVDLLDDLSDLDSSIGIACQTDQDNCSFQWMEVESKVAESDMASWYLEADLVEYGEMREYSYLCYNGEDSIEQEEYCSLWE